MIITITQEHRKHAEAIESLLDMAFGLDRYDRPSYLLRTGIEPEHTLCFVAHNLKTLVGSIRFWPIYIPGTGAGLLLGPIAVNKRYSGQQIGSRLINKGIHAARQKGADAIIAIGSPKYLSRFGFVPATTHHLEFPGKVMTDHFLVLGLSAGVFSKMGGLITKIKP